MFSPIEQPRRCRAGADVLSSAYRGHRWLCVESAWMAPNIEAWVYHEAGHAVVAEACGRRVKEIRWAAKAGEELRPAIGYEEPTKPGEDGYCHTLAVKVLPSIYGGMMASVRRDSNYDTARYCASDSDEVNRAVRLLELAESGEQAAAHKAQASATARSIVDDCWGAIEAIAKALAARDAVRRRGEQLLNGCEIRAIIRAALEATGREDESG